jgi:hypothetical protein
MVWQPVSKLSTWGAVGGCGAASDRPGVQEDARIQAEAENDEERKMREYRAQLDAERASRLARGTNHAPEKSDKKSEQDVPVASGVWAFRRLKQLHNDLYALVQRSCLLAMANEKSSGDLVLPFQRSPGGSWAGSLEDQYRLL